MTPSSPWAYSAPSRALEPLSSSDGRVRLVPTVRPEPEASGSPAPRRSLARPERLQARIVKSRFGYYAHLTYGLARVGEAGSLPFSFTRRGIERKISRLERKLQRQVERRAEELQA